MGTFTNNTEHEDLVGVFEGFPMSCAVKPERGGFLFVSSAYVREIMDEELVCSNGIVGLAEETVTVDRDGVKYAIKTAKGDYAVFGDIELISHESSALLSITASCRANMGCRGITELYTAIHIQKFLDQGVRIVEKSYTQGGPIEMGLGDTRNRL